MDNYKLRNRELKLTIISLSICIIYCTFTFNGLIDDFAPKHIIKIEEIAKNAYLDMGDRGTNQIPGFYAYGAILKLVTNISSCAFLLAPILFIPYLIIYYVFFYKLSNSNLLAAIVTMMYFTSGTVGTTKLFFWPHGVGDILHYTILLILTSFLLNNTHKPKYEIMLIVSGISLAFVSYNFYAISVLYLVIFSLILAVNHLKILNITNEVGKLSIMFMKLALILIIVQSGLSNFIYTTFIPTLTSNFTMSASEKFMITYFQTSPTTDTLLTYLSVTYSDMITTISLIKYSIICLSILFFLYCLIKKYTFSKSITFFDQFVFSFILVNFIYGIIRSSIGGLPITLLYFPGILSIVWLYSLPNWKKWSKIALIIILILNPIYTNLMNESVPKNNIHNTGYIEESSNWLFQYKSDEITPFSDELTRNLFQFYIYTNTGQVCDIPIITLEKIAFILQNQHTIENSDNYYILNYKSKAMSIQSWIIIKSWKYSENIVNSNSNISKIYDNGGLSIYL